MARAVNGAVDAVTDAHTHTRARAHPHARTRTHEPTRAQVYCTGHSSDGLCNDGGASWAIAPVGTAARCGWEGEGGGVDVGTAARCVWEGVF